MGWTCSKSGAAQERVSITICYEIGLLTDVQMTKVIQADLVFMGIIEFIMCIYIKSVNMCFD